jgi:two-component system cell cycle sensor histidine kinase/response regulator CckA
MGWVQVPAFLILLCFMEKDIKGGVVPEPSPKQTIMVVEDEPTLRALVRKVLERVGYAVIEAPSGLAALEFWNEKRPHVDLLLTDMIMPDGISGRQLGEKLKAENPKLKIVYTTGYSADLLGSDFVLNEGVNFLQKPYPPQKLVQTVRNGLNSEEPA